MIPRELPATRKYSGLESDDDAQGAIKIISDDLFLDKRGHSEDEFQKIFF